MEASKNGVVGMQLVLHQKTTGTDSLLKARHKRKFSPNAGVQKLPAHRLRLDAEV
jgi:hypothetical protein